MPDELKNCQYLLVEYAPSALRETRLPIGLFLFEASGRLVKHAVTRDWRQLRCLHPQADFRLLESLAGYFDQLVAESAVREAASGGTPAAAGFYEQLRQMQQDYSGTLQISLPRGVRTASPEQEFERLFQEHVARPRASQEKRPLREGSRPWIHARLRQALQRRSLWDRLSKDVPVEQFTAAGDGFRIDFGYRPNGVTKYLHAISLERDLNQSKLLSYTFWRIRQTTEARMTAIVADGDSALPMVRSCRQILAGGGIAIQPLSGIDSFLDGVIRELNPL